MSADSDPNVQIPVTQAEDFVAEFHEGEMDLSELYDKQFVVAVSTGDRNKCKHLASTLTGPYDFVEMVDLVADLVRPVDEDLFR